MADLNIDVTELTTSASRAERIASDFSTAERIADETAGYTGHDGLAGKVRDFGDKWDIARHKLEENLTTIAQYLRAVVDTFDDLDTNLASSLRDSAQGDAAMSREIDDAVVAQSTPPVAPAPAPTPSPAPGPAPTAPSTNGGDH
ncbi:hypothetical protein [Microbacterium dextranolyticum]|uniref:WXG100 family type VII secretion target n=1 Tax=Microbacterium dextranolyticum TaxID=36806 RepID=A0A9W6M645_9MICO|nr:hypothetical protein [Microbacterium dextranolyticum]MBM7463436.1 hypothetical protein [Microbacterium dextranolyticum]GLJ95462.1 hypothetical protein GCM10017591_15250 [Microbacterium dextranolyticum]